MHLTFNQEIKVRLFGDSEFLLARKWPTCGAQTLPAMTFYGLTVSNSAQINMLSATAGVVIYNTYSNYPAAPGGSPNCGQIDFDTTGQVTLRPVAAGSYAGIVIVQDPACPTADTMRVRNTGARNITGTIYLPNTNLSITSSGAAATLNLAGQFVVWQYDSNPTDVNLTFAPATSAGARVPALVE